MKLSSGLVSTIIPVYNRSAMLREAVGSVVAQTYRPIEIIIVDDGSTDETADVCQELVRQNQEIVRIVRQNNGGPGLAREAGRRLAQGEFIQYLDSDDLLCPHKFEVQVAALRDNEDCGVAYCGTREYVIGEIPSELASFRTGERFETLFPFLLSGRCWQTVTPLFRRAVCDQVGPWADLRQEEDWEYDARVGALKVRLVWCPQFLAEYRHHGAHRAGGNSLRDQQKMRWRSRAHMLIYQHARRAGIEPESPHMQRYARELFLLARQCGAAGLAHESQQLFALAQQASGPEGARSFDFRLYQVAADLVGWPAIGQLACWVDCWRPKIARFHETFVSVTDR